jgi:hypothetical protein
MALQVLNQSIDAVEFQPLLAANYIGNFNDLNSGAEYISEILLGCKNLFPEYDRKTGSKQSQSHKHVTVKMFQPVAYKVETATFIVHTSFAYPLDEHYYFQFSKEINPPPPKA